jgi:hypothetical protein
MTEFIYPTRANRDDEWLREMLSDWRDSKKKYLCFSFARFKPHTLDGKSDFWMYMYYRKGRTDIERLKGVVEFRIHVIQCFDAALERPDTHTQNFDRDEKIWFHCDGAEEIRTSTGGLLTLASFEHTEGKQLPSTIRSSIAPVICHEATVITGDTYP